MNIGTFKVINGQLLGSIATVSIDLPRLGMRPVESDNDKAPAYEIVALNVARRWVQVGALWEATSNSTGEVFYQAVSKTPALPNRSRSCSSATTKRATGWSGTARRPGAKTWTVRARPGVASGTTVSVKATPPKTAASPRT
ncbi:DUF736 family protein [Novosphingobium sp. ST904]|uniref:DUF736 family protein n=1 Tax=Novosphingobium sp. ST904 TaxID=1684385 RepID=UPI00351363CD